MSSVERHGRNMTTPCFVRGIESGIRAKSSGPRLHAGRGGSILSMNRSGERPRDGYRFLRIPLPFPVALPRRPSPNPNTVETVVTCCVEATSGSLSPCGRGPGRGGQGSTNRLVRGRGQASSPLSLPSPARGEGELKTGRPLGYSYFNGIAPNPGTGQARRAAGHRPRTCRIRSLGQADVVDEGGVVAAGAVQPLERDRVRSCG